MNDRIRVLSKVSDIRRAHARRNGSKLSLKMFKIFRVHPMLFVHVNSQLERGQDIRKDFLYGTTLGEIPKHDAIAVVNTAVVRHQHGLKWR